MKKSRVRYEDEEDEDEEDDEDDEPEDDAALFAALGQSNEDGALLGRLLAPRR